MADRGLTIGSTNSLHALAGDNIPREYHRKVLKKIAQLTKVSLIILVPNEGLIQGVPNWKYKLVTDFLAVLTSSTTC